jgi:hypothetical protein
MFSCNHISSHYITLHVKFMLYSCFFYNIPPHFFQMVCLEKKKFSKISPLTTNKVLNYNGYRSQQSLVHLCDVQHNFRAKYTFMSFEENKMVSMCG